MAEKIVLGKVLVSGGRSERVFTFEVGGQSFPISLDPDDQIDFRAVLEKLGEAGFVQYNGNEINPAIIMTVQSSNPKKVTNDLVKIRVLAKGTGHEIGTGMLSRQDVMDLLQRLPSPQSA